MITDQKTQNRLHADTGTELFSIRQRKEAVTRMLDILKETPEYLQVMNHIPAYAMDDDTSEWWNSEESENFMNSLLEVMESYTPDGYRFGPKSGTTDLYGYWESKTGRTTLFHLLFSLESVDKEANIRKICPLHTLFSINELLLLHFCKWRMACSRIRLIVFSSSPLTDCYFYTSANGE